MIQKWLKAYALEALQASNNDDKKAKERLIKIAQKDHELREALIRLGADQVIRDYFGSERRISINPREFRPITPQNAEQEKRILQKEERRQFWDRYTLFGHQSLREAYRPDLKESAQKRIVQAEGSLSCAAFEKDMAGRMKNDRITVGRSFTNTKIIELAKVHHVI